MHFTTLHGIHGIQSGCLGTCCKKSTAFIHAAGIQCIQSCCTVSTAFSRDVLGHAAENPLHYIGMLWAMLQKSTAFNHAEGIHCIQSCCIKSTAFIRVPFLPAAWITRHSITLHGILCIQSGLILPGCIESTAFNQYPLHHTALNPLHSIEINWATLHRIHCIEWGSI